MMNFRFRRVMEILTEQTTNDDDFDPQRQASSVYRTFALFCCVLFLFWTVRFQNVSEILVAPSLGESTRAVVANDEQGATTAETTASETEKNAVEESTVTPPKLVLLVDLNAATQAELTNLPGIGEALAERIVEYRESVGRFSDVDELLEVKGIGVKKLANARPFCVVANEEEDVESR